jgi:hypothetical protein
MSIVEPVFGNLRWAKGLSRFTLRGKKNKKSTKGA